MDKLCKIRDLQRSIITFESRFEKEYGISLNEGMALCSIRKANQLTSGELGDAMGLTPSNISKVLKSIEQKQLVNRTLGDKDKRQMLFSLSNAGKELINSIDCEKIEMTDNLKTIVKTD